MPQVTPPPAQPPKGGLTQQQKIVAEMCSNPDKKWWLPQDFMQGGQFFVGYEASARLSELQSENPDMFESQRNGRFIERRIVFENIDEWLPKAKTLKSVVGTYYKVG